MQHLTHFVITVSLAALIMGGIPACTTAPTVSEREENLGEIFKQLGLTVGSGGMRGTAGYFALFGKHGSRWQLTAVTTSRPAVKDFSIQEVLFFSDDLTYVQPDYRTSIYNKKTDTFVCWTGAFRTRKDNAMTDYNPCESSLTKMVSFDTGAQILFTAVTFGVYSLTGTSSRSVGVDKASVLSLLQETNALRSVQEMKAAVEHKRFIDGYRAAFHNARTSTQLDAFIRQYSDNDLENLVPRAIVLKAKAVEREAAKVAAEKERRRLDDERRRQTLSRVQAFRRSIGVGTETNCGPILEAKGDLLKIYAPVANYGNEHWMRIEEVYPPGFGCRFFNGRYEAPVL